MDSLLALAADPTAWAALFTLIVMEVVLGIDNLIFISILTNKLPPEQRTRARRIGIGLALIAGGLFLVWKATREIHHSVEHDPEDQLFHAGATRSFASAIVQILMLDLVFSIDSIVTAVGMTDDLPVMVIAVIVAVAVMLLAADPLANFIQANPTIVMLALGFLMMIGMVLIADGFGVHVPKGYIYAAMSFSALIEALNMMARRKRRKQAAARNVTRTT
jgi:predicted tellurium resistance membrane protein TerC